MKKKQDINYLDKIPVHPEGLAFKTDENGIVTLEVHNKGAMNRFAQLFFNKPKVSYIHLDETGSFVWPLIDGKKSIFELAKDVDAHFGEKAHPLHERLIQFFRVLESYKFINWIE